MKPKILLAATFLLCVLASCKKNSDGNSSGNNATTLPKIKMYVEETYIPPYYNEKDTFYVTYDNDGRLTALTGTKLKFAYGYNGNTSYTLDLFENGVLSIQAINYIKGSYVDSAFQYNNSQDTSTDKYTYNGNLLISDMHYLYTASGGSEPWNRHTYTYDNNGNMIKDVDDDGTGRINNTATMTYTDKLLQVTTNPSYYPLPSKYLPATRKVVDNSGSVEGTVTYYYTFDNAGRLTKELDSLGSGNYAAKYYSY